MPTSRMTSTASGFTVEGFVPGAVRFVLVAAVGSKEAFGHLAAARVSRAEKQYFRLHVRSYRRTTETGSTLNASGFVKYLRWK